MSQDRVLGVTSMIMINLPLNLFLCKSPIDYSDSMEGVYQKKVSLYRNRTFMFFACDQTSYEVFGCVLCIMSLA